MINEINKNEEKECKGTVQYILNELGELTEIPKDQCKPVEYPINYKLKNAFEVFVRVDGTENYWISNYGRTVNNLNHKDKNTFYAHKEGKWVGMCGEMAGEPDAISVLMGLGLDEFSMSATSILRARKIANSLSHAEMKELAAKAVACSTSSEVLDLIHSTVK